MARTREFKETVAARVQRDPRFREALFTEAINACLAGETTAGKAILRDLVNATVALLAPVSPAAHLALSTSRRPSRVTLFPPVSRVPSSIDTMSDLTYDLVLRRVV